MNRSSYFHTTRNEVFSKSGQKPLENTKKKKKKPSRETFFLRDYLEACTPQENVGHKYFSRGFTHQKLLSKDYNPVENYLFT